MTWKKIMRETGLIEYVCEHGVGHPDHESARRIADRYWDGNEPKQRTIDAWLSHGCDGCCSHKDFPGKMGKRDKVRR